MSETKIQVPYGMLKAAMESREKAIGKVGGWSEEMCRPVLEAALLYQREHPPVPTDEQAAEILNKAYADTAGSKAQFQWAAREWVRRMYDAPEPGVLDDLLWHGPVSGGGNPQGFYERHNREIREAYALGLGNSRQEQKP